MLRGVRGGGAGMTPSEQRQTLIHGAVLAARRALERAGQGNLRGAIESYGDGKQQLGWTFARFYGRVSEGTRARIWRVMDRVSDRIATVERARKR